MDKFKIGDRVKAPLDFGDRVGKIETIYESSGVAMVVFDDEKESGLYKFRMSELCHAKKELEQEEKPETTINSAKFQEIAIKTVIEESDDDLNVMLAYSMFVSRLHKALFGIVDE